MGASYSVAGALDRIFNPNGDEAENDSVSVRYRTKGDIGTMTVDELCARMLHEIETKAKD